MSQAVAEQAFDECAQIMIKQNKIMVKHDVRNGEARGTHRCSVKRKEPKEIKREMKM